MCSDPLDAIMDQIEHADLSATAYRTAIRLMRLARANDGQVRLSRRQAIELCGSESDATMRTHLYQIARVGIVEYHAGADVFVRFVSWPLRAERANEGEIGYELRAQRANKTSGGEIHALGFRAERVNLRAQREKGLDSVTHARSGKVGRSLSTTNKKIEPTYPPKSSQTENEDPLEPMQQLALELLEDSDVGVLHEVARKLVKKLPAVDIFRQVDRWLPDRAQREVGTGALVTRLKRLAPSTAQTVILSTSFRDSELFHRHRLPDEMMAVREAKYNRPEYYTDFDDAARRSEYAMYNNLLAPAPKQEPSP